MPRVPLQDNIKRSIVVEDGATRGATLGVNLYEQVNGEQVVLTVERLRVLIGLAADPDDPGDPNNGLADTTWQLVQEIPANILALAALTGDGYPYRRLDGTWVLRRSGRAVIPFAYGDASPLDLYITQEDGFLTTIRVVIEEAFDGVGAEIVIGDGTTPDLYMAADENDPGVVASYEVLPDVEIAENTTISATITPGAGASAGAGRIIIETIPIAES